MKRFFFYIILKINKFLDSSLWLFKSWLVCVFSLFIFTYPANLTSVLQNKTNGVYEVVLKQIKNPFDKTINNNIPGWKHEAKRVFRVTVPIIAKIFRLNLLGITILELITNSVMVLYLLYFIFFYIKDKTISFLLTLALCFTPVMKMGLFDSYFTFECLILLICLICMLNKRHWVNVFLIPIACFVDERAYFSMICVMFFIFISTSSNKFLKVGFIGMGLLLSVLLRLLFKHKYGLELPSGEGTEVGFTPFMNIMKTPIHAVIPLFCSFEFFWLIIGYALYFLLLKKQYLHFAVFVILVIFTAISSCFVHDITRSMIYYFPLVLSSLFVLKDRFSVETTRRFALIMVFLCWMFPSILGITQGQYFWMSQNWKYLPIVKLPNMNTNN